MQTLLAAMVNMLSQIHQLVGLQVNQCTGMYPRISESNTVFITYLFLLFSRVIFWNAKGYGWSIGETAEFGTGRYWHKSGLDSDEPWQGEWGKNITVECIEGVGKRLENDTEDDNFFQMTDIDNVSGSGVTSSLQCLLFCYFPLLYLTQCVRIV